MKIGLFDGDALVWRFGWIEHNVTAVNNVTKYLLEQQDKFKLDDMEIFLETDPGSNFRYKVFPDYKIDRKDKPRPPNENLIRTTLFNNFNSIGVKGAEVDDALGVRQCENTEGVTMIFSNDKDLDMIPGWHCDIDFRREVTYPNKTIIRKSYKQKGVYKVTDPGELILRRNKKKRKRAVLYGSGQLWFCAQMLLGDSADGIPGLSKLGGIRWGGEVTAYEYLKSVTTYKEGIQKIWEAYKSVLPEDEAKVNFIRNAKLLWIKRAKGKEEMFDKTWLD